jgi:hypothetical protein
MIKRSNFQIGTVLKPTLISAVLCFMVNTVFAQNIPKDSLYLGQVPPGNTTERLSLSVNKGFFAGERIAKSPDGSDIYYSEIKSYYPIKGENIKRYSCSEGKWTGPFNLFDGYAPTLSITGDTMIIERKDLSNISEAYISVKKGKGCGIQKEFYRISIKHITVR